MLFGWRLGDKSHQTYRMSDLSSGQEIFWLPGKDWHHWNDWALYYYIPSRIPQKWHFEDDFPFPKLGYVNSLGIYTTLRIVPVCNKHYEDEASLFQWHSLLGRSKLPSTSVPSLRCEMPIFNAVVGQPSCFAWAMEKKNGFFRIHRGWNPMGIFKTPL